MYVVFFMQFNGVGGLGKNWDTSGRTGTAYGEMWDTVGLTGSHTLKPVTVRFYIKIK